MEDFDLIVIGAGPGGYEGESDTITARKGPRGAYGGVKGADTKGGGIRWRPATAALPEPDGAANR